MRKKNSALLIDDILRILPHRQPFVFIDRVLEFYQPSDGKRVGRKVKALKNVSYNEPFFAGHFPQRAVMPGVIIIEAMAQACALACTGPNDAKIEVAIGRVGEVRFHAPVVPGDQLIIEGEVTKDRGQFFVCQVSCSVDGELIAKTEILATVQFSEKPKA